MKNEVNEIVKPIILRDSETKETYTLEFNRESVYFAEARGFSIDDVVKQPMTKIHELFFYAFRMHHQKVSRQKTDKILDDDIGGIGNLPEGFIERLYMLYGAPFDSMVEDEGKNSKVQIEL